MLEPTPVQAAVLQAERPGATSWSRPRPARARPWPSAWRSRPALLGDAERFAAAEAPLALVVAPTRELALQVERELAWLYAADRAPAVACVGGMDIRREQRALAQGAHIVVGTPGRLRDHLERGNLDISALKAVVLDEADEMLDLGFREDLEFILDATPPERRTLLFSATIPQEIAALAKRYQRDALRIATTSEREPHGDIEYRALRIAPNEREHAVVNLLRFFEAPGALVFCATRESVRHLHASLVERGFSAVALSGELTQNERTHALQALRDGRARVCVATDVAARGLDLPDLGLVIHADLPNDREALLHRSGRTGRAGRKGVSVLIVPYTRRRRAEQLLDRRQPARDLGGAALGRRDPRQGPGAAAARAPARGRAAGRGARGRQGAARQPRPGGDRRRPDPPAPGRLPAPEELFEITPEPPAPRDGRRARRRARAAAGRRRGLVPHERRPRAQRRPALADPADLPPRPRHQARDRLDPDLRARDPLRDRAARGRPLRHRRRPPRQGGRVGAHRAAAHRAAGAAGPPPAARSRAGLTGGTTSSCGLSSPGRRKA